MPKSESTLLKEMISLLTVPVGATDGLAIENLEEIWRGLVNQCPPQAFSEAYLALEDEFLSHYHQRQKKFSLAHCQASRFPQIWLHQGDVRHLAVDAVVNAANSDLLGCFIPNHACIDNTIHTYAGGRLRLACAELMRHQGRKETVGQAKLTAAYHLPAKFVIHTVGPYIQPGQPVSRIRQDMLKACYVACLNLAQEVGLQSLAFCPIATGQFGFPPQLAAELAVTTVREWLATANCSLQVIFNQFTQQDQAYYQQLLL
ncbi:protein-ADP-ribose hydrolase [Streptococcus cuniculipharyngis]|uniref:Protein-ADP-ribose hydrolase n=1 Tax=Streptococcus cuniculipharyngis TaxID=1562651 RepID=A0A5C5SDH7_9STRE|nr:protein-ADP-ribose hydrolase [Streptococcus cuniculipharyngis]TWS98824.1 protein-ADP-ribose hydrolase [Streptococcus cuniculipharyngis]